MLSKDFDFEKSLKELEEIANSLEKEQTSLDDAVTLFEKGIKLPKECSAYLESARQKIISLTDAEKESADND